MRLAAEIAPPHPYSLCAQRPIFGNTPFTSDGLEHLSLRFGFQMSYPV